VDGLRQPGSAIKPFTYLTALSQGYTAATMVMDVETDFGTPYDGVAYVPQNDDGRFHGPMRLRRAFANSYNVPAVEVMSWVGVNNVIRTAHNLGITSLDGSNYGLSLTLGGGEVRLIDMVYAFSVLDNRGLMVGQPLPDEKQRPGYRSLDPVAILRVEDGDGDLLYEYDRPQQQEIVTPQLAFLMNDMMSDRTARCPAFGCPNPLELPDNRPTAAKTGTTNDFRDAWTVGYTPQLATGVWVGNTDNAPMDEVPGVKGAAPIWHAFMSWALQDEPAQTWTRPPGIVETAVCDISGLLPTAHCPTVTEYFIEGTEPATHDNIHRAFQINRQTGRLATIYTPPELIDTRVYRVFPERAADWVRENDIEQPPTEYDTITGTPGREENLAIDAPEPFALVNGQVQIQGHIRGDDFSRYRLAYFQGLTPDNVQVIVDEVTPQNGQNPLGNWDAGDLNGLYTLILTAFREDGTFEEVSVPVTVDNAPPAAQILSPVPNQAIFTDEEWLIIQAAVEDDVSIDRVEFYLDDDDEPFAVKTAPPFTQKWTIPGPGCHRYHVVAVDAAGNETSTDAVRACLVTRDGD
jgi:membrane carboxypeptidase/penicillin-binding protein PbpC